MSSITLAPSPVARHRPRPCPTILLSWQLVSRRPNHPHELRHPSSPCGPVLYACSCPAPASAPTHQFAELVIGLEAAQ